MDLHVLRFPWIRKSHLFGWFVCLSVCVHMYIIERFVPAYLQLQAVLQSSVQLQVILNKWQKSKFFGDGNKNQAFEHSNFPSL